MLKTILSVVDVSVLASNVADGVKHLVKDGKLRADYIRLYGVPRGGIPAAYAVASMLGKGAMVGIVPNPDSADVIIDDIIDSGATRSRYPNKPFFALVNKLEVDRDHGWVVFPWEQTNEVDESATDIPLRLLQRLGEDPNRDGLRDTPSRVVRSWETLYSGYNQDPKELLRVFDNEERYDQMVILRDIEYYSMCEHHMLPFFGKAHIAYIPKDKVLGVSKMARLVDCFSRRLQIQERLTQQIADFLFTELDARGVAVYLEGQHLCMMARGVQKQGSVMVTCAIRGAFAEKDAARMEFLLLHR